MIIILNFFWLSKEKHNLSFWITRNILRNTYPAGLWNNTGNTYQTARSTCLSAAADRIHLYLPLHKSGLINVITLKLEFWCLAFLDISRRKLRQTLISASALCSASACWVQGQHSAPLHGRNVRHALFAQQGDTGIWCLSENTMESWLQQSYP